MLRSSFIGAVFTAHVMILSADLILSLICLSLVLAAVALAVSPYSSSGLTLHIFSSLVVRSPSTPYYFLYHLHSLTCIFFSLLLVSFFPQVRREWGGGGVV